MSSSSRHTFVFRGNLQRNPNARPDAAEFIKADGTPAKIRVPRTDGIVFGFMETPKGLAVTQIDEIILANPLAIDFDRHLEGGGLGPQGRNVDESSAATVVDDAIRRNPNVAAELSHIRGKIHEERKL